MLAVPWLLGLLLLLGLVLTATPARSAPVPLSMPKCLAPDILSHSDPWTVLPRLGDGITDAQKGFLARHLPPASPESLARLSRVFRHCGPLRVVVIGGSNSLAGRSNHAGWYWTV